MVKLPKIDPEFLLDTLRSLLEISNPTGFVNAANARWISAYLPN